MKRSRPCEAALGVCTGLLILANFTALGAAATQPIDARQVFEQGQQALNGGDLSTAEKAFRQVLASDPKNVGAHGNLAVVYMRRREWRPALAELQVAERLAPGMTGIRLNIGLAYYRQSDFQHAIAPLESVLRDEPSSKQPRYLLGLCYFFSDRYAETVQTLEPLWQEESGNLSYLYVVAIAAGNAGRTELDQRATSRLAEVGRDTAELHLFLGKGHVAHAEDDQAMDEFEQAARINPKALFVHYYMGTVWRRRNELERAKVEFLKDVAIEPDVAFNYDQLGIVCYSLNQVPEAERYFKEALRLDAGLGTSSFGLAKIYKEQGKYREALSAIRAAAEIDPQSASAHYLHGQILFAMGRRTEARAEFDEARRLQQATRDELERKISGQRVSDPQLTRENP
jgi:tetratricopeptide (TPR) repeat protein